MSPIMRLCSVLLTLVFFLTLWLGLASTGLVGPAWGLLFATAGGLVCASIAAADWPK